MKSLAFALFTVNSITCVATVAGLRKVVMTPPYFHDGSVASLSEAVRIMAKVQLDTDLSGPEGDEIVAFHGNA
jgi:cytochrome c peroxidase